MDEAICRSGKRCSYPQHLSKEIGVAGMTVERSIFTCDVLFVSRKIEQLIKNVMQKSDALSLTHETTHWPLPCLGRTDSMKTFSSSGRDRRRGICFAMIRFVPSVKSPACTPR